jgi:hypothetical protein
VALCVNAVRLQAFPQYVQQGQDKKIPHIRLTRRAQNFSNWIEISSAAFFVLLLKSIIIMLQFFSLTQFKISLMILYILF